MFTVDLRSLSLFRIALSAGWIWMLLMKVGVYSAFHSEQGVFTTELARVLMPNSWFLFPHLWFANDVYQAFLFGAAFVSALFLLTGAYTRVAAAFCWILCVSTMARMEVIEVGMEEYLAHFLFLLPFLPCGSFLSWDAYRRTGSLLPRYPTTDFRSPWSAAFLVSLCLLYFTAGFLKDGITWQNGSAMRFVLSYRQMTTEAGRFLLQFPELLKASTYLVRWWELLFPFLFLLSYRAPRLRTAVLLGTIGLHVGIAIFMEHLLLPYLCIAGLLGAFRREQWVLLKRAFRLSGEGRVRAEPPAEPRKWALSNLAALGFIAFMLVAFSSENFLQRPLLGKVGVEIQTYLRLQYQWKFYNINPPFDDGEWRIHGSLESGREVQPFLPLLDPSTQHFANPYWFVFSVTLRRFNDPHLTERFARFICREWNHQNEDKLRALQIAYLEINLWNGRKTYHPYFEGSCPN
ncbi:MAG TPA: hypothetical protein VIH99_11070 [Bdellovibrionota bacterium]|jgi:hypothetical protein